MSIATRAITSAEERLAQAIYRFETSRGCKETKAAKWRQVELCRYVLEAVKEKAEREATP